MPQTRSSVTREKKDINKGGQVARDAREGAAVDDSVQQSSFKGPLDRFLYRTTVASSQNRERRVAQSPSIVNGTHSPKDPPLKRPRDASPSDRSPSSLQKRRKSSKYAGPSTYAHLPKLKDIFTPQLICIFIGTNPGIRTATAGHAYAHPSNLFWRLLHTSGLTDRRCDPSEDVDMPRLYAMGNTNIVERPSKDAAQLSKKEMEDGAWVLEAKMRLWRPESVCIVGKGIWEAVVRAKRGTGLGKGWQYGWQDARDNMGRGGEDKWEGARVFVATSTSGLAVSTGQDEKEAIWKPFGDWVRKRRLEKFGKEGEGDYLDELWKGNEELRAANEV